jgi:hypothetical protein
MRPMIARIATGATGTSNIIQLDHNQVPFAVGFGLVITGTVTASVQHTFDDFQNSAVTPTWFNHSVVNGVTASTDGNYAFPVMGIRINMTAGTGTATMTVIQAGGHI